MGSFGLDRFPDPVLVGFVGHGFEAYDAGNFVGVQRFDDLANNSPGFIGSFYDRYPFAFPCNATLPPKSARHGEDVAAGNQFALDQLVTQLAGLGLGRMSNV